MVSSLSSDRWPELPLNEWLPTYRTLHRWTQIVGKTRLTSAPFENHWWNAALYVTPRGLTTSAMPYRGGVFSVDFDFQDDRLIAATSNGETRQLELENKSVADFYREYRGMLETLDIDLHIVAVPNEISDATPFAADDQHATYDGDAVRRWWQALIGADRLLRQFRGAFSGKSSPSHFWWGAFDLACTRFSGRIAPKHPGGVPNCPDWVMTEAYSHECISAGFWPGTAESPVAEAAFYAYAYPEPDGCSMARIRPDAAYYSMEMREWILPYEAVRTSRDPDAMILEFLESTYEAAALLAKWDMKSLQSEQHRFNR
jgi:hypothetical protein